MGQYPRGMWKQSARTTVSSLVEATMGVTAKWLAWGHLRGSVPHRSLHGSIFAPRSARLRPRFSLTLPEPLEVRIMLTNGETIPIPYEIRWEALEQAVAEWDFGGISPQITDGQLAPYRPEVVSIRTVRSDGQGSTGTGTFITRMDVLTAAHVVDTNSDSRYDVASDGTPSIRVSQNADVRIGTASYQVASVTVHPGYRQTIVNGQFQSVVNDLAILHLVKYENEAVPAKINRTPPRSGQVFEVLGYGQIAKLGSSVIQNNGNVRYVGYAELDSVEAKQMSWALDQQGESTTRPGDSGGPSFLLDAQGNRYLSGVTSNGSTEFFVGAQATVMRVDAYQAWIDDTIQRLNSGATPSAQVITRYDITTAVPPTNEALRLTFQSGLPINYVSGKPQIALIGPNGYYNQSPRGGLTITSSDGTSITQDYYFDGPGGTWTASDNGAYTVVLVQGGIVNSAGAELAGGRIATINVNVPVDSTPPTATSSDRTITVPGRTNIIMRVSYSDPLGLDGSTFGNDDVQLVRNDGMLVASGKLMIQGKIPNKTSYAAMYEFQAPGGSWDAGDNGTYRVIVRPGSVRDVSRNGIASSTVATVSVNIPAGAQIAPWAILNAPNITTSTTTTTFTVTYYDDRGVNLASVQTDRGAVFYDITVFSSGLQWDTDPRLISVNRATDGSPIVATYEWTVPSAWKATENGTRFDVTVTGVVDTDGNSINGGYIGAFQVNISGGTPDRTAPQAYVSAPPLTSRGLQAYSFDALITDDVALNLTSITDGSLIVVAPNGQELSANVTGINYGETGAMTSVAFALSAPNGVWESSDNGLYRIVVRDGTIADSAGNFIPGYQSGAIPPAAELAAFDVQIGQANQPAAVTASLSATNVASPRDTHEFSVVYECADGVDTSSLGDDDVYVVGPNAFAEFASFVSYVMNPDANHIVAFYRIAGPGGTWDLTDNGDYVVGQSGGSVLGATHNSVTARDLGTFTAQVGANSPPVFTSAGPFTILENGTVAGQIVISDPDAQPLGLGITGGADATKFTINGDLMLVFLVAPDYENPNDADHDNVYHVTLIVNDFAGGMTTRDVTVTVLDAVEVPIIDLNGGAAGTGFSTNFSAGGGAVAIVDAANLSLTDPDSSNLTGATVALASRPDGSNEILNVEVPGGSPIQKSYANGVLTLAGTASVSQYQAVLRSLTYRNTASSPTAASRTIGITVSDGGNTSVSAISTVSVTTASANLFDIDGSGGTPDGFTDGALVFGYLAGASDVKLAKLMANGATRSLSQVRTYLDGLKAGLMLDADGSGGAPDGFTDGALIFGYLAGASDVKLAKLVAEGAPRSVSQIRTYLDSLMGGVTPQAAALSVRTQPPAQVVAGTPFSVTVAATDSLGNIVTNFSGTASLAFVSNPNGAVLSGLTTATFSNGLATFMNLAIDRAAAYSFRITTTGLTAITTNTTTVTARLDVASSLSVQTQPPAQVVSGTPFSVTVAATDSLGNIVTNFSGTASLAFVSNPNGAVLSGLTSATFTNGLATFTNLAIDKAAAYSFRITTTGLAAITTNTTTVTTRLDVASAAAQPFATSSVTLRGGTFDTTASTTVTLTDLAGREYAAEVVSVESISVTFTAPFLIDFTTGSSTGGTVAVRVAQQTQTGTRNYDSAQRLTVADLPTLTSPAGTLSTEVLTQLQSLQATSISDYQTITQRSRYSIDTSGFLATLNTARSAESQMQSAVASLMASPQTPLNIGSSNGVPVVLSRTGLELLDRVFAAVFSQLNSGVSAGALQSLEIPDADTNGTARDDSGLTVQSMRLQAAGDDPLANIKEHFRKTLLKDFVRDANDAVDKLRTHMGAVVAVSTVVGFAVVGPPAIVAGGDFGAITWLATTLPQLANSTAIQGAGNAILNGRATVDDFRETIDFAKSSAWSALQSWAYEFVGEKAAINEAVGVMLGRLADAAVSERDIFFGNETSTTAVSDQIRTQFQALQNNGLYPPTIGVSQTSFTFDAPIGGTPPEAQYFLLSNSGDPRSLLSPGWGVSGQSYWAVQVS